MRAQESWRTLPRILLGVKRHGRGGLAMALAEAHSGWILRDQAAMDLGVRGSSPTSKPTSIA